MKKLITIVLSAMLLVGCSSTKELQIDNEQKYNLVNNICYFNDYFNRSFLNETNYLSNYSYYFPLFSLC